MPISRLSSSGFDSTKYKNSLSREANVTTSATPNAFTTILSVNGPGYIDRALVQTNALASEAILKITVDGVVVFNGKTPASNNYSTGLIQESQMNPVGTAPSADSQTRVGNSTARISPVKQYPFTGATAACCILSGPLTFNASLLVEVASSTASSAFTYSINGGAM